MASNSAIWQVQSGAANGTEATATSTNTILFNESPVVSTGGVIFTTDFNVRNSVAENTKVDGNGNAIQDMGLDGIDIQITGLIKDSDSGNGSVTKLMSWIKAGKTTTGYTEGRFGLRLDDFPFFNMVPTSTYGLVINNVRFVRDPEKINKVGVVINLRVGGDITSWLAANGF